MRTKSGGYSGRKKYNRVNKRTDFAEILQEIALLDEENNNDQRSARSTESFPARAFRRELQFSNHKVHNSHQGN